MASLETNKLLAAVLTAGIIASGSGVISRIIYSPEQLEEPVYTVALPEGEEVAEDEAEPEVPIANLLVEASVEDGETEARKCAACHSFEAGGAAQIGPPLWDVVGREIAAIEGFAYSDDLAQMEGEWTFEQLSAFIENPKAVAPGTKMAFAGIRDEEARADLLSYLQSLSDDPVPLPEPVEVAEAPAEGEAPVEAEAPAEGEAPVEAEAPAEGQAAPEQQTAAVEAAPEGEPAQAEGEADGVGALIAAADPAAGESAARKCVVCHSFDQGGPNKIGPVLFDVVGRDIAAVDDFAYSDALVQKEGEWDYESLDAFLANPREWAPGTKMAFAGVRTPEERAEIIAYMRSLSEDPPPLPGG